LAQYRVYKTNAYPKITALKMHVRRVTHLLWKNRCTTKMLKAKTMQNAKACVEMQLTKHSQNIMSSSSSSAAFSCPNIPLLYLGLNVCTAGAEG